MKAQAPVPSFRRLALIGLALASGGTLLLISIWMYGVKQELLRQKLPCSQTPDKARDGAPYIRGYFRGDLIGYSKHSVALQLVRSENRIALLTLANAGAVLRRDSDFLGNTPDYVTAFDSIGEDPAALFAFRELVLNASPAGRIYGLCGLCLKKAVGFSLARKHLAKSSRSLVWVQASYDVFEQLDIRELAERPEGICQKVGGVTEGRRPTLAIEWTKPQTARFRLSSPSRWPQSRATTRRSPDSPSQLRVCALFPFQALQIGHAPKLSEIGGH